jgi:molecular chaperone HtpG
VKAVSDQLGAGRRRVADLATLLDQAHILDGEVPDDPAAFAARVNRLIARGLASH